MLRIFPPFPPIPKSTTNTHSRSHTLIATISENMTVSTSPTFICKDVSSTPFALTLGIPADSVAEGVRGGGYDVRGFKKGFTVAVPGPRRSGVKEGKQGFVEVAVDAVKVCDKSEEEGAGADEK